MFVIGKLYKYSLIITSALLYSLSFIFPAYACFGISLFLVPLFYAVLRYKTLTFMHGLVWGILVFLIQYHALFWFFIQHGHGAVKSVAWFLFMVYIAAYAGAWFWLSTKLSSYSCPLFMWCLTTLGYFYIMTTSVLWIFGKVEGILFSFPLVPLAHNPSFLSLLPWLGKFPLFAILILTAACLTLGMTTRRPIFFLLSIFFLTPFLYGCLISEKREKIPNWLDKIGFIKPPKLQNYDPWSYAENIMQQIIAVQKNNSNIQIIIGPESTFPFALNECSRSLAMWCENSLNPAIHLLIGSHAKGRNGKLFNSLYWIHQGRIILTYDKTHTMPFTEKVPYFWQRIFFAENLFLHKKEAFSVGCNKQRSIALCQEVSCLPYICSELFFNETAPKEYPHAFILALVNDAWFSCYCMKYLMELCASFKALEWQRSILYVSHNYQTYITRSGLRRSIKIFG